LGAVIRPARPPEFDTLLADFTAPPARRPRLPSRIQAHALICFLALVLYRALRLRLKDHGRPHSPERALEIARRIQHHQLSLHQRPWAAGFTTLSPEQQELFAAVGLPLPTAAAL
jgi:hypothetical protein